MSFASVVAYLGYVPGPVVAKARPRRGPMVGRGADIPIKNWYLVVCMLVYKYCILEELQKSVIIVCFYMYLGHL